MQNRSNLETSLTNSIRLSPFISVSHEDAKNWLPTHITGKPFFTKQGYCLLSSGFNSLRISSLNSLLI